MQITITPPPEGVQVHRLVDYTMMQVDRITEPTEYWLSNANQIVAVLPIDKSRIDQYQLKFNF